MALSRYDERSGDENFVESYHSLVSLYIYIKKKLIDDNCQLINSG